MKQRQPDLFTEDYHINRSNVYPSLDKAFFQIWYGPKEVGKTTEARMLVRQVSMAGQPVLYLSYKDLYTFDPFLKCFITYLELPKDSRFPEMTFSYLERALINEHAATKTAPLLVIDDINRASADDVLRWVRSESSWENGKLTGRRDRKDPSCIRFKQSEKSHIRECSTRRSI
eukprot:gb/GECG01003593.1/.p1 GENE.gb/GECG01003593.1/~~gb/GECG01003593.1/.p1  ORF type:complete len:173 (+),score=9.84 gb/GECG01003593.1/:1-519(+)